MALVCPSARANDEIRIHGPYSRLEAYITDFMKPISKTQAYKKRLKVAMRLIPVIVEQSQKVNIDPLLVGVIISFESSWDPNAKGKKGECGYMQIMPGHKKHKNIDICDPETNIRTGIEWLNQCFRDCSGNVPGALTRYGTGGACRPIARFVKWRLRAYRAAVKRYRE
jgi:soluble lytic murein transglycosylase-like protein